MTSMNLTLVAASLNDQPLSQPITAVFDSRGGTIGRADHNTMTLPDPQRHVSRLQAEVLLHGRNYILRNVGAANPIVVGSRTLAHGENATLTGDDDIRIGGYLLKASLGSAPVPQPSPTLTGLTPVPRAMVAGAVAPASATPVPTLSTPATPAPAPSVQAPVSPAAVVALQPAASVAPAAPGGAFADLLGPSDASASQNPFADLLGSPAPAASAAPAMAPAPARSVAVPAAPAADPFADLLGSAPGMPAPAPFPSVARPSSDPFADLLGASPSVPAPMAPMAPTTRAAPPAWSPPPAPALDPFADLMPPPAGVHARSAALAPPPPATPRLPDDFDPFALPASPAPSPRSSAAPVDPFADLMPVGDTSGSIDALFGLGAPATQGPSTSADPLASFMGTSSPSSAGASGGGLSGVATDPLALFRLGAAAPPAQPLQPAQPDQVSALHAAWQPPRVQAPMAPPVPVPHPPAAPLPPVAASADAAALWAAFCQGAGIAVEVPPQDVAARLYEVGRVLRSAVDGSLQLIAVRASTKHELRAGVTVIQQRDNNPLKFSPDARLALEQLLQPPLRGFLDGPAAMDDAMHDLVGHAIGSVAGLRAAVEGMLERFAPQALESKLAAGSLLDSLLPMNRRARLWDLYLQHSQAIREEAQEDFHTLFGKAFVAAYEQQIERLKRDAGGRK